MSSLKKHLDQFYEQTKFGYPSDIRYSCLICGKENIRHDCGRTQHLKKMHPEEYRVSELNRLILHMRSNKLNFATRS